MDRGAEKKREHRDEVVKRRRTKTEGDQSENKNTALVRFG